MAASPCAAGLARGDELDATVEAAARRWQAGVGLVADGIVGPRCRQLLGLRKARSAPTRAGATWAMCSAATVRATRAAASCS